MNQNIEIISKNLWAVKFNWLPWIPEIQLKLDPSIPINEQILAVSDKGIIVLNADNQFLLLYKNNLRYLQKLKPKVLRNELFSYERIKKKEV